MYEILDIFFYVFHTAIIIFMLCGFMWKKTRKPHLVLAVLVALSWSVLGIWYGFGYCPFTDWHHQARVKLGQYDMPNSYIKFLVESVTGWDVNAQLVDFFTMAFFLAALTVSIAVNLKKRGLPDR